MECSVSSIALVAPPIVTLSFTPSKCRASPGGVVPAGLITSEPAERFADWACMLLKELANNKHDAAINVFFIINYIRLIFPRNWPINRTEKIGACPHIKKNLLYL